MGTAALGVLGLAFAAAGCNTMALCGGGEPLSRAELPEWARRQDPRQPSTGSLQEAAAAIEANPRRWRSRALFFLQSVHGLGLYDPGTLLPPLQRRRGEYLLWDGVPGHRLLSYRGSGDTLLLPPVFFICALGSNESRGFGGEGGRPTLIHRVEFFASIPYSCEWSVRPAGPPLPEYLRDAVARTADGVPAAFRLEECHLLLGGLLGVGRVNRTRYLQFLWIPIPVGTADPPAAPPSPEEPPGVTPS